MHTLFGNRSVTLAVYLHKHLVKENEVLQLGFSFLNQDVVHKVLRLDLIDVPRMFRIVN